MKIVAKHSGAVISLGVTRGWGHLISGGSDGTVYVYGGQGNSVSSRLRNAKGCIHLGMCDGGNRLLYLTNEGSFEHRSLTHRSTGIKYHVRGVIQPRPDFGEKSANHRYEQVFPNFVDNRFAMVKVYDWDKV